MLLDTGADGDSDTDGVSDAATGCAAAYGDDTTDARSLTDTDADGDNDTGGDA